MSNIEEILNENTSLEEKIQIIQQNAKNNFEGLKSLNIKTIESIQKEIQKVLKQSKKSKSNLEHEIETIENQIKNFQNGVSNYSSKEEYKEAFKNINEKAKEKQSNEAQVISFERFIDKGISINNMIKDIVVDVRKNSVSDNINNSNSKIQSLENEIKQLNSKIEKSEIKFDENEAYSQYLQRLLDNSQVDINSKPLSEREMDLAMSVLDTIYEYNEENLKLEAEIEEEKLKLEKLEDELEHEKSLLSKNENKKEKQEKQEKTISDNISRFEKLCSKEKLSKLESSELKSLYQIINSSSYLKSEEKNEIYTKYITSNFKNKEDNYEVEVQAGLNENNNFKNVSKVTSTIAKGKLATIKLMQKAFKKLADSKINTYGKIIDFLSAKKDLLEKKQGIQEELDLESEEIEEVNKRVM